MSTEKKIAVIGLGYVGLPLARLFATKYPTVGFDINQKRIDELRAGHDSTLEVEDDILQAVLVSENPFTETQKNKNTETQKNENTEKQLIGLFCSNQLSDIADANFYVVTVPTPVDKHNRPDLTPLYKASETVGRVLKKGDIVVYESTVYPGVTEEECIPVLEKISGLKFNEDFFAGYSPERINPGDKEHTVEKILKVTSGSTPEIGKHVDAVYKSVITAGTHLAPTIKVAEAAKVIENSQRDINIAFVNELAKIFNILGIDTHAVLEAAGTKWNFLPFKPGLVGGHCIGVDPYYLAQKAQEHGYHPEIILAGRRLNDSMGEYVASQVVKCMIRKGINVCEAEVLMLGITFKENCPDVRNTKIVDVIRALEDYGVKVSIYDPWANPAEVKHEYGIDCCVDLSEAKVNGTKNPEEQKNKKTKKYDAIVLGVAHKEFLELDLDALKKENGVVYDVKGILQGSDNRL
ncbi:nucleotide sugar dehydrogenase [Parapedobacter sp. SGR-10]|uniref:nucleotide sugar dehydrogenase n=1 Tax=Parapedobacter sp. SGR-10 TaxID=2710879 RepID=UPI0013D51DAD|nr:nucleotide sugar dehydrogenase [Parapedobacter sp. SGR-10]NGF56553.1 nucleotide sugar dehydrogenase [Parapedobacter sp. SGR-10]